MFKQLFNRMLETLLKKKQDFYTRKRHYFSGNSLSLLTSNLSLIDVKDLSCRGNSLDNAFRGREFVPILSRVPAKIGA